MGDYDNVVEPENGGGGGYDEEVEDTIEVQCSRCNQHFQVTPDKLTWTSRNYVVFSCPSCKKVTTLSKDQQGRVKEFLYQHGRAPPDYKGASVGDGIRVTDEGKSPYEDEEEIDPKDIVIKVINEIPTSSLPQKLKGDILTFINTRVQPLTPGELYDLLKRLGVSERYARMAYNRYVFLLETHKERSQRIRSLLDIIAPVQGYYNPLGGAPQYGYGGAYPQPYPQVPYSQPPQYPGYGPFHNIPPQQPQNPQHLQYPQPQPYQYPQVPQAQPAPVPAYQQPRQVPAPDQAEIIEEELDESGKVKKRIVRKPAGSHGDQTLEILNKLIDMGIVKPQQQLQQQLQQLQKPDVGTLLKELKSVTAMKSKTEDDEVKRLREEIASLKEELKRREIETLQNKLESIEKELLRERERLEKELERVKKERFGANVPESVQEMQVRKELFEKVGSDVKEIAQDTLSNVVKPLVDVMRLQNVQAIAMQEQAGILPPGTAKRVFGTTASKEEVESVKNKLSKLVESDTSQEQGKVA